MGKLILVTGGARSGKSTFALESAKNANKRVAFVATSPYYDGDMTERIQKHKDERPPEWVTFEEQKELPALLKKIAPDFDIVIIECLTLFVSNFLLDNIEEKIVQEKTSQMLEVIKNSEFDTIIVSNEVGLGLHPNNKLGRDFRDVVGRVSQMVANQADDVFFVICGIPVNIKELKASKMLLS